MLTVKMIRVFLNLLRNFIFYLNIGVGLLGLLFLTLKFHHTQFDAEVIVYRGDDDSVPLAAFNAPLLIYLFAWLIIANISWNVFCYHRPRVGFRQRATSFLVTLVTGRYSVFGFLHSLWYLLDSYARDNLLFHTWGYVGVIKPTVSYKVKKLDLLWYDHVGPKSVPPNWRNMDGFHDLVTHTHLNAFAKEYLSGYDKQPYSRWWAMPSELPESFSDAGPSLGPGLAVLGLGAAFIVGYGAYRTGLYIWNYMNSTANVPPTETLPYEIPTEPLTREQILSHVNNDQVHLSWLNATQQARSAELASHTTQIQQVFRARLARLPNNPPTEEYCALYSTQQDTVRGYAHSFNRETDTVLRERTESLANEISQFTLDEQIQYLQRVYASELDTEAVALAARQATLNIEENQAANSASLQQELVSIEEWLDTPPEDELFGIVADIMDTPPPLDPSPRDDDEEVPELVPVEPPRVERQPAPAPPYEIDDDYEDDDDDYYDDDDDDDDDDDLLGIFDIDSDSPTPEEVAMAATYEQGLTSEYTIGQLEERIRWHMQNRFAGSPSLDPVEALRFLWNTYERARRAGCSPQAALAICLRMLEQEVFQVLQDIELRRTARYLLREHSRVWEVPEEVPNSDVSGGLLSRVVTWFMESRVVVVATQVANYIRSLFP
jgi:AraC-like DNA-binding protein